VLGKAHHPQALAGAIERRATRPGEPQSERNRTWCHEIATFFHPFCGIWMVQLIALTRERR
jgi:hypothetical protein